VARIRDPIHGSILVDERERAVIDSPALQRLRHVRQLGFADLAFPGATHSRHAHALGAAHVVGRVFDAVAARCPLGDERERGRLRAAVRLAALLHDAGHAPFSHSSEAIMPPRTALGLPGWAAAGPSDGRATHEDFTLHLILASDLADLLRREYGGLDLPPEAIASIVAGREAPGGPWFRAGGVDCGPLLRQVVSSELDADRMDYLQRDSFYTGANYGKFDVDWLIGGLGAHVHDGVAELSLSSRAIFAFEDFLLSRYHMFLSVYFHHTPTCFDHLLKLYYRESPGEFEIPAAAAAFVSCDDVTLLSALRASGSPWARRITRREPYRLLVESSAYDTGWDLPELTDRLAGAGMACFTTESRSIVSKYFGAGGGEAPIWVEVRDQGLHVKLAEYTPLFQRYEEAARIERLYVEPERFDEARRLAALPA
jgi:hypothetical protein